MAHESTSMNTEHNDLNPEILLGQADHRQLTVLAMAGLGHTPDQADQLLYELERAHVVDSHALPDDIVRMGSRVTYRTDSGHTQSVELVYPVDADISAGRISVLTPVGTALIGLRQGQSITWRDRAHRRHMLTVLLVEQPA
jgi:regulator of nucleoside diphosphate kinase